MITGYNDDINYNNAVYHIQTEDMGLKYKKIVTHVFIGGAILFSKKTSYEHLLENDEIDDRKLRIFMNDQHKMIIKIIKSGKIEYFKKKLDESEGKEKEKAIRTEKTEKTKVKNNDVKKVETKAPDVIVIKTDVEEEEDETIKTSIKHLLKENEDKKLFNLSVKGSAEIIAGEPVVLKIGIEDSDNQKPLKGVKISIKVVGLTFRPAVYSGETNENGIYTREITIPSFTKGTAAILIKAEYKGETEEKVIKVTPQN